MPSRAPALDPEPSPGRSSPPTKESSEYSGKIAGTLVQVGPISASGNMVPKAGYVPREGDVVRLVDAHPRRMTVIVMRRPTGFRDFATYRVNVGHAVDEGPALYRFNTTTNAFCAVLNDTRAVIEAVSPLLKVKLLDGQDAGESGFVMLAPVQKRAAQSSEATTILNVGKELEKAHKPDIALNYYRRLTREFSGSAEAKEAVERIKAIGATNAKKPQSR